MNKQNNKTKQVSEEAILPPPEEKELTRQEKLKIIELADDTHVLMKIMVEKLGLDIKDLTQNQIIHSFSQLQLKCNVYRKELMEPILSQIKTQEQNENQTI